MNNFLSRLFFQLLKNNCCKWVKKGSQIESLSMMIPSQNVGFNI